MFSQISESSKVWISAIFGWLQWLDIGLGILGGLVLFTLGVWFARHWSSSPKKQEKTRILAESIILNKERELWQEEAPPAEKIKKFQFAPVAGSKEEEKNSSTSCIKEEKELTLTFDFLHELNNACENVEATYRDFLKGVTKSLAILEPYLLPSEQQDLQWLLQEKYYQQFVEQVQTKIEQQQQHEEVAKLRKSRFYKYLLYGKHLENPLRQEIKFDIDPHNLKLYSDIRFLLENIYAAPLAQASDKETGSFLELLNHFSWQQLQEHSVSLKISELGREISQLLVQDCLATLERKNRKPGKEYKFFRALLKHFSSPSPREIGAIIKQASDNIVAIHHEITEHLFVSSAEVARILMKYKVQQAQKREQLYQEGEKELRKLIFSVVTFLGWYPKDESLLNEQERDLVYYFDRVLCSRRLRLEIVEKGEEKGEGKLFAQKMAVVRQKTQQAEAAIDSLHADKDDLIGTPVEVIPPRQCEDYFPHTGTIEDVFVEPEEFGNVIRLEVRERSHLCSFVIFTGNNVKFLPNLLQTNSC